MRQASRNVAICANSRGAAAGTRSPRIGYTNSILTAAIRDLFPDKPWSALMGMFGISYGAARKKIAGQRELSTDELATLLRSDHGREILVALMADAEPQWWRAIKREMAIADARRLEHAAKRKLKEAIDADADLCEAISRADAALAVPDANRDRERTHAYGAIRRVPDRALAPQAIGRKAR